MMTFRATTKASISKMTIEMANWTTNQMATQMATHASITMATQMESNLETQTIKIIWQIRRQLNRQLL